MGYSFEQRKKAVELYMKYGKSVAAVRNELGYPSRQALYNWYHDYLEHGFRPDYRPHEKFDLEMRRRAVDHYLSHGKRMGATERALGYPGKKGLLAKWIDELAPGERRLRAKPSVHAEAQIIDAVVDMEVRDGTGDAVAAEHGMGRTVVYKWKRSLLGMGKSGSFSDFELSEDPEVLKGQIAELQREVRRLRLQKDVLEATAELLKKTGAPTRTGSRTGRRRSSPIA